MGEQERKLPRISAAPLFERLDASKGTAAKFAALLNISHGRLANWRTRGIPGAVVPTVAGYLGISTDEYLRAAGWDTAEQRAAQPKGQYTIEGQKFLEDFYALPEGLQEHIARKTAQLRQFADALPSYLRDSLKPPTDPERYRAWERDIEADLISRIARKPAQQKPALKKNPRQKP